MRLIRSWPATIPEGRSYVVDGIDRLVMDGFDYRCLADVVDDIVLIEWDIAVGADQLETFMGRAAENPDQVRVAPYLLYPMSTGADHPFYVHRRRGPGANYYVRGPEDEWCSYFGFGLTYLPRALVLEFLTTLSRRSKFSDTTFSYWHHRFAPRSLRQVPIDWDCHAVHLHSRLPEVPS